MGIDDLIIELKSLADHQRASHSSRFFKTGPGEYGEGDMFLGLTTPAARALSQKYRELSSPELQKLLSGRFHEYRSIALMILTYQYQKADGSQKKKIVDFYLKNTQFINNWDLVDISAPKILGDFLLGKDRKILYRLAKSENLWERRIAIMATFAFIRENQFEDTFKIAEILLPDKHDLIHKAVGWMLREVGKRNQAVEESFLEKYSLKMSRTMLRYAIEKFNEDRRQHYLKK